jgi:hypothetical protein
VAHSLYAEQLPTLVAAWQASQVPARLWRILALPSQTLGSDSATGKGAGAAPPGLRTCADVNFLLFCVRYFAIWNNNGVYTSASVRTDANRRW